MKEIDWSYLGAFIDGEGCVDPVETRPSGRITIVNTDKILMYALKAFLDKNYILCSIFKRGTKQKSFHKDVYVLTINGKTSIRQIIDKCSLFNQKIIKRLNALEKIKI